MKQYWPMAVALDNGNPVELFTYDSCLSIESAEDVFKKWQNDCGYTLLTSWIQVDGQIVAHAVYVDAIGGIRQLK